MRGKWRGVACVLKDTHFTVGKYTTVFPIIAVGITVMIDGQKICVDADFFEGEWYVPVTGGGGSSGKEPGSIPQGKGSFTMLSQRNGFPTSLVLPLSS